MDFAEARATAPNVPPETCPTVDLLKTFLDALEADIATVREEVAQTRLGASTKRSITEGLMNVESGFAFARGKLEELRAANHGLRDSSYHWYSYAKSLEEN